MAELIFEGKVYILTNQGWTCNNEIVHQGLQKRLFDELEKQHPMETLMFEHIMETADALLNTGLPRSAARYYVYALAHRDATLKYIRYMLPRLSSCYRRMGESEKSIELLGQYAQPEYESVAFLTSVGAAYLDIGNVEAANHFACRAYGLNGGHADHELHALFAHIDAVNH